MISYNLNVLRQTFSYIAALTGNSVTFYDHRYISSSAHSNQKIKKFCLHIKRYEAHGCTSSDTAAFLKVNSEASGHHYYKCHAGLIEIVDKIVLNNEIIGYVMIGPFRDVNYIDENLTFISSFAKEHQLNETALLKDFSAIPVFKQEKYEAIIAILDMVIGFLEKSNYLLFKNDVFTYEIEPYILNHLEDDLSIANLCEQFHFTNKQLHRLFLEATNLTPKNYITKQRVYKARELLISTDMSLPLIASKVGFSDYNYFLKLFKQYFEKTPMYFRKSVQNIKNL